MANAMDVGHPSNFERMMWLCGGSVDAMRREVIGLAVTDDDIRLTIRDVSERTGYLLDPHSAIGYLGLKRHSGGDGQVGVGVFLATAHPAKFSEIVEPIVGHRIEKPEPLADAIARPRHLVRIDATFDAVRDVLCG
jgi:threonine synthase